MTDAALVADRVLVIGGAGFVGSNLVRAIATGSKAITVVDNFLSAEPENVPDLANVRLVEGSIADDRVLAQLPTDVDYVFHLATYHGNQSSIADPLADHDNNLITTLKLLEWAKHVRPLRRFVYSASGCTLAAHTDDTPEPVEEDGDVPMDLDSPYQISKVVGEFYCVYYHRQHGIPTVRARFQNVYGPGEILGAGRWRGTPATVWRNVTPTFIYRALKEMPLVLDNGGEATRDFIYVDDIVDGLVRCATRGRAGDVYNLASGIETSIRELAELINEAAESRAPAQVGPRRTWDHSGRRVGSTKKASTDLGFSARTTLRDGIEQTIAWTRANLDLIDRCVGKHEREMRQHTAAAV
jgi:UDP-glucose 4-epimerase